jgi:hypothetical protein
MKTTKAACSVAIVVAIRSRPVIGFSAPSLAVCRWFAGEHANEGKAEPAGCRQGRRTPGVDGILWTSDEQKFAAVDQLKRRGYRPQPLRRIYILKKNGKLRPLSIPTVRITHIEEGFDFLGQNVRKYGCKLRAFTRIRSMIRTRSAFTW